MNPLKKRIGVLGGGQLGRMMIEETLRLNVSFNILENDKESILMDNVESSWRGVNFKNFYFLKNF